MHEKNTYGEHRTCYNCVMVQPQRGVSVWQEVVVTHLASSDRPHTAAYSTTAGSPAPPSSSSLPPCSHSRSPSHLRAVLVQESSCAPCWRVFSSRSGSARRWRERRGSALSLRLRSCCRGNTQNRHNYFSINHCAETQCADLSAS